MKNFILKIYWLEYSTKVENPEQKQKERKGESKWGGNKKRQTENLTASTTYPCFRQDLGDSEGAGSSDLPGAKIRTFY
ncbi:hypothetical protein LZD49_21960 [Dyadobacter sp. CY261]|uniref:hypothetical protein n=1 Tax=Dyadobacter sp. CY261 TaxID=2907203 RepID=UPI001F200261|nr:hypothetical protein [Dyadobacter sp. CY261]MCF0073160.1 hypothetical protein [Dyadobacter sp. CY261]